MFVDALTLATPPRGGRCCCRVKVLAFNQVLDLNLT